MFVQDEPRVGSAAKRKRSAPLKKNHVLKVIQKYQTSMNLLIRKAEFGRLVREVALKNFLYNELRWQTSAISFLQEASKAYLINFFSECKLLAHHAKCVTVI